MDEFGYLTRSLQQGVQILKVSNFNCQKAE